MEADEKTGFEAFCGDPIFNETLLLNSQWPQFTNCFQDTLLTWIPCGWLLLTLPFKMGYLCWYSKSPAIPFNPINTSKTFLSVVLCLLTAIDLLELVTGDVHVYNSQYVAGAMWTITFCLSAFLIQMERSRGVVSSGVMWIFWFMTLLANIVPFYTKIYLHEYDSDRFHFILFYIAFGCVVLQFLLSSIAEKLPRNGYEPIGKKPSPELSISFPNKLIFWWLNSLVFNGYRRPLTEEDVYDLNPRDTSDRVLPPFTRAWNRELAKAKLKRRQEEELKESSASYHSERVSFSSFTNGTVSHEKSPLLNSRSGSTTSNGKPGLDPKEKGHQELLKVSLFKVIFSTFVWDILKSHFLNLLYVLQTFISPLIMTALIAYTQELEYNKTHGYEWKGYILAISLFVVNLSYSIFLQQSMQIASALGMRVKSSLVATVYRKSLTISNEAKKDYTMGEIVNLMSVDCQRIQDFSSSLFNIWALPLQMAIAMYMLWGVMGIATLAGLAFLVLIMPLNGMVIIFNRRYQRKQLALKDKRLKLMGEILNGIKVLKLYAWENTFQKKVESIRAEELVYLRKAALLRAFISFIWTCAPFLVTVCTFATYILASASNTLTASRAFEAIVLLNLLRAPINQLPSTVSYLIQMNVSLGRVSKFLRQEDLDQNSVVYDNTSESAIRIDHGTFMWDKANPTSALTDISLDIPEGKLVAVVGQVGSGKSSLLSAMLGEMEKLQGQVTVKSSIAYVPQQAWIQNMTLRANVLFGKDFDRQVYSKVIDACALTPDLDILPARDATEIGEKGINLSGGQKQRVSLARAVYNDADIYLLDDPLSAVDSHVAKHIFDHVISDKGSLKGKTRVLVTHGVQWLPQVDLIIVLSNGKVSELGSYDELLSHDGDFAQFLKTYLTEWADSEGEEEDPEVANIKAQMLERVDSVTSDAFSSGDEKTKSGNLRRRRSTLTRKPSIMTRPEEKKEESKGGKFGGKRFGGKGQLVEKETAQTGKVKFAVFWSYLKAVGLVATASFILFLMGYQGTSVASSIWITKWTSDDLLLNTTLSHTSQYMDKNLEYLGLYGVLAVVQAGLVLLYAYVMAFSMVKASRVLHNDMLENIMKNPMSFFDTTPSGRVMNRFSRDVDVVDNQMPMMLRSWLNSFFGTLTTLINITYATPIFVVMILPLSILYYLMQRFYIPTSRQLKRMESNSRSPIYTHFSETVAGAATIRAYSAENRFIETSKNQVDRNLTFYYAGITSQRWLSIRLQFVGNILVLAAALFLVMTDDIDPSLVGLSISSVLTITGSLNNVVRTTSSLETNIVSVERIREYSELPTEAPWINPMRRPKPSWPEEGYVHFYNYQTRYRPGLDLVLKGVNCSIKGGEKIGVVGRTGAGKSSLTLALFRLIEAASGSIHIDGTEISAIGLHDLRSKVTILPQDPVLFSGTLRMNVDPINQFDDVAIWQALEHAHLKKFVEEVSGGLSYECGEGGQNLSVGQRQLLCLARSLLRKTKILVLDEATAAVDMETDDLIQQTIRSEFKDCTVLSIAHRLNTILDYDRVMVLDQGQIVEMDTPTALLDDKTSVFYGMAKNAKIV